MEHAPIPTIDLSRVNEASQPEILVRPFGDYLLQHHKNLDFAHRHSFYHLVMFTKGQGSHTIDFTKFTLQPYQIYFMIPGQVHAWDFMGKVDGYVVNFSESFFQSFLLRADYLEIFPFFRGIAVDGVVDLPVVLGEEAVATFEKLLSLSDEKGPFRLDRLRVLLLDLFMRIGQQAIAREAEAIPPHHYTMLKNYQQLIEKNFLTLRRPKEYADLLAVSSNHLNALCKAHLGKQAGELIRNRILLEAKRLLVNLDLNVAEVGYALNFSDNSYFTRFFRKYTGQTPEEFRHAQRLPEADEKDR
ncbi:helix-turn-helix domain-containing protein [Persicitalea jodogahamensis]|uniref:AraC family transcriptional regulator n=1 Tax=Persicitalea jodogahamensis TaxID=402147 RepID=A0A8J3GAD6_9BACT|nr:helix-turn-helix domain-containing protein [Persicitalea jodogahamensis]GHB72065.1 AraC family transcriptional regulator [Persicitalea jodogahamensis]